MNDDNANKSKKPVWIGIICAGVVIIGITFALLTRDKPEPTPEPTPPASPGDSATAPQPEPPATEPETKPGPAKGDAGSGETQPVVDYGKLKEDKQLQTLMDQRKDKYGFEKGVDLIIKPDETVKVGDEVIPMKEILDKIRLKRGEVIEKDITDTTDAKDPLKEIEKLVSASDKSAADETMSKEKRKEEIASVYKEYKSVDEQLKEKKELLKELADRKERLAAQPHTEEKTVDKDQEAKPETYIPIKPGINKAIPKISIPNQPVSPTVLPPVSPQPAPKVAQTDAPPKMATEDPKPTPEKPVSQPKPAKRDKVPVQKPTASADDVAKLETYMKSIQEDINSLMLKKGDLEGDLKQLLTDKKKPEAYGIYVVQHGDNIWDVHFDFLKEYFTGRGISLEKTADEPDTKGKSSGVGKILKFSENMVYIYNTRKRRLEPDIDLIHPLSKIVVFNMGQVLELLESVALGDIEHIQFDGDNLWLPAES